MEPNAPGEPRENPYAAPATSLADVAERANFPDLSTREIKLLCSAGASINALAILWLVSSLIGLVAIGVMVFGRVRPSWTDIASMTFAALLVFATAIGARRRLVWGRWLGILVCLLQFAAGLIGVILGLLGVLALSRARPLFGANRLDEKELRRELKRRRSVGVE